MSEPVRWQLLSQHLEAMSLVNGEFEDLILLVRQLVQVLESESALPRTGTLSSLVTDTCYNLNEELQQQLLKHRRMVPPINSVKHYVHRTNVTLASAAIQNNLVATSVVAPATGSAADVREGSVIKAIFVEIWLLGGTTSADTTTQFLIAVEKVPTSAILMTHAQSLNLGAYPNKKNILYTTQGVLTGELNGPQAVPIIRGWIMIPKGKQRMGLGDRLVVNIANTGVSLQICGIFTYKEYV